MRTRTEEYFLHLFGSATLRGAAEAAADRERSSAGETSIPVDVHKIATRKGFRIVEDLVGPWCDEGQLLPVADGYRVRLRRAVTDARKRFSLAHEIGHSFFYKDQGVGPRHVIGVLNASERSAEERICNLFSSALLMPRRAIRDQLQGQMISNPASMLSVLQTVASTFKVSMPALLVRLESLELETPTCLLTWSTVALSPKKQANPKLRIEFSLGLGDWSNRRFWKGTSVADVGIMSALRLHQIWKDTVVAQEAGRFAISSDGALDHQAVPCEISEPGVSMSRRIMGLWKHETVQCTSSSELYCWKTGNNIAKEYVVTAIVPGEESGTGGGFIAAAKRHSGNHPG